ncbi:hypothetical protein ILUMI_16963 [Ignelater luminosus]|uniref:Phospholipase A2 n=1 Tax=Ignelater luminosus TaxID=2038154 RepID=A0A8K0CTB5_IGNLU|nr:hypothetical protein ILUMI_16963 [Ignelater luminosus]
MKIINYLTIPFIKILLIDGIMSKPLHLPDLLVSLEPSAIVKYAKVVAPLSDILFDDPNDEHGQLASVGRNVLNELSKVASNIGEKIGRRLGVVATQGLDTNKSFTGRLEFMNHMKIIFPGTLFCGQDNIAKSPEQLGLFNDTDSCCRDHDHCEQSIPAGEKKYGLSNTGLFTRSHCDCDTKFYNCLKKTDSIISNKIGFTFFSVLGPQCFKLDYPQTDCNEKSWGRCVSYGFNEKQEKKMQWFDNPVFVIC